ncbi:putative cystine transporter YijE [Burkholderiales bacterium]|nr:putative cystine transporter YijE [Burkholderiales bacterium]
MSILSGGGSPRGAYLALAALTVVWGANWVVMKLALANADPVVLNVERTWLAVAVLFAALASMRNPLAPQASWTAIVVTGFFQTTVNFGATTMALAGGGAGRTSVLVFTMPFWTLVIARIVLHERVRGLQWLAVACAFAGLTMVVAPWDWRGDLAPKLWATLSGLGWAAGTVATKYFQREHPTDPVNFIAWQMLVGVLPLTFLALALDFAPTRWSIAQGLLFFYVGAISTAFGFLLWVAVLKHLPAGTASLNMFAIPPIALVSSMAVFGERLTANEWTGIGLIGAGLAILAAIAWRASRRAEPIEVTPTPLEGG